MAHGMLSDLPIEYGIYSDLFGCIFFTLLSTSRHTSTGSAAFLMMIIASSIEGKFDSDAERNILSNKFSWTELTTRPTNRPAIQELNLRNAVSVTVEDKLNYIRSVGIFVGLIQLGLPIC